MATDVPTLDYAPLPTGRGPDWHGVWRWARWVLGGFCLLVSSCTICALMPATTQLKQNGWVLNYSYSRVACQI